jgi:hypothetical protein
MKFFIKHSGNGSIEFLDAPGQFLLTAIALKIPARSHVHRQFSVLRLRICGYGSSFEMQTDSREGALGKKPAVNSWDHSSLNPGTNAPPRSACPLSHHVLACECTALPSLIIRIRVAFARRCLMARRFILRRAATREMRTDQSANSCAASWLRRFLRVPRRSQPEAAPVYHST